MNKWNKINESYEDEDDGWSEEALVNSGVADVLSEIQDADYELSNCIKGVRTGCKTYKELGNYLVALGERLSEAGEELKYFD